MNTSNHLSGQKILVTGASGFIGSHLCSHLCNKSAEVHAISRSSQTSTSSVNWWYGDAKDFSTIDNIIRQIKPDVIYHLASNVTGSRAMEYILPTLHSNLVSTVNLLTTATEIGCKRIVLAGSLEEPEPDQFSTVPSSPYAAAKWASSIYAPEQHHRRRGAERLVAQPAALGLVRGRSHASTAFILAAFCRISATRPLFLEPNSTVLRVAAMNFATASGFFAT